MNLISASGTVEFQRSDLNKTNNSFVKEILSFKGVELVLFSDNFISVKKTKDMTWDPNSKSTGVELFTKPIIL